MYSQSKGEKDIELQLIGLKTHNLAEIGSLSPKVSNASAPNALVSHPRYNKLGIYFALMSAMATVVAAVIWKWNPSLPRTEVLTVRSALACAMAFYLSRKDGNQLPIQDLFSRHNIAIGLCGALSVATYSISLLSLTVSEATTIYATLGIFNGIFGLLFLKEAYPKMERLIGGACFFGVLLRVRPPFLFGEDKKTINAEELLIPRYLAALVCVVSTALWSLMQIILRAAKNKRTGYPAIFQNNLSMTFLCGINLVLKGNIQSLNFEGYFTGLLLALCNLVITFTIIKALEHEKPSVIGIVCYSEIIFAIGADVMVFHNLPSLLTMVV